MDEVRTYELAEKDYMAGMKYKDIAEKYGVSLNTVKSWKQRYWTKNKKSMHTKQEKVCTQREYSKPFDDGTRETMLNENLTPEQRLFCIYYSKIFNATQSYLKAYGCSYNTAMVEGSNLLRNPKIRAEIQRLQEIKRQQIVANTEDIVDLHMRIAFADIGDYVEFGRETLETKDGEEYQINKVLLKESSNLDTQIIQEVKQGREGVTIKLADKQKSLEWLDKYFLINPLDKHKIEYENKKLELEQKKIEPDISSEGVRYTGIPATMIIPKFAPVAFDIQNREHIEYVFPGGRGSTKSSFISLQIIDLLMKNEEIHAVIVRQVADTLRTSVYAQMQWAIEALGLEDEFYCTVSPLEITRKSTGQKIYFRGTDDPGKIKSIKVPFGYIGIIWFEELDQFQGEEAVRKIEQSVIRGGEKAWVFKSFNPPKSANNWANKYIKVPKVTRLVIPSTYLDVPKEWLGKPFIDEAEFLKEVNPTAYENEYLGVANGTGGNIFDNVTIREITDAEIKEFDRIYNGVDWGWYPDPYHFSRMHYDSARHKLYIFMEYRCWKQSNQETANKLRELGITENDLITCDSAEQKSVSDYKAYGLLARGAEKGPGSVDYSMKWLQSLSEIIIDNRRCPYTAEEFLNYEYERDKEGNIISGYPDKNNHAIDAVRYAMNPVWKRRGQ